METDTISDTNSTVDYIKSLSPKEYKAYLIAKHHLGMSFDIEKSIGFLYWISQRRTK
jgi:hypothetical protein